MPITEKQKKAIIESGKDYFRSSIIPNHIRNLQKLRLKDFDVNPFLINYLSAFLCGDTTPHSMAKALVYPRILGTRLTPASDRTSKYSFPSLRKSQVVLLASRE